MFRTPSYGCSPRLLACGRWSKRLYSSRPSPFTDPKPPSLPPEDQKEWEESMNRRQPTSQESPHQESDLPLHPDARKPVTPDFEGDINPVTGEIGGPKKEPLPWGTNGEWTYGGRATDF